MPPQSRATVSALVRTISQSSGRLSAPSSAPFLRFDFADTLGLPGPVCFSQPERVIVAHDVSEVVAAFRAVEEGTRQGLYAAGYVAYEAAPAFDDALVAKTWTRSRRGGAAARLVRPLPRSAARTVRLRQPTRALRRAPPVPAGRGDGSPTSRRTDYRAGIDAVKDAIARGDTYQVNYTFRLRAEIDDRSAVARQHDSAESMAARAIWPTARSGRARISSSRGRSARRIPRIWISAAGACCRCRRSCSSRFAAGGSPRSR